MSIRRLDITYCEVCGDGWSDEDFMFGVCCHRTLKTRPETDEEYNTRLSAERSIAKKAERLGW